MINDKIPIRLKSKSEYGEISLSIQKRNEEEIASCPLTCLVRCHGPDPNSERAKYHLLNYTNHGQTTLSASGVSFGIPSDSYNTHTNEDSNFVSLIVITHANIITPFLNYKTPVNKKEIPNKLIPGTGIEVLFDDTELWYPVQFIDIVEARGVMDGIQKLSQKDNETWEIGFSRGLPFADLTTPSGEFSMRNVDIAGLAILKVVLPRNKWQSKLIDVLLPNIIHPPTQGTQLLLMGSPFGILNPKVFLNSVTHGMLSNVVEGHLNEINLLTTDARVLPGYEGGVAIENNSKKFIGIIMPPLRRKNRYGTEVGLIIPALSIKQTISKYIKSQSKELSESNDEMSRLICEAKRSVVLIYIKNTWASGIVVSNSGHIITNAHVLYPVLKDELDISKCFVNIRIDYPYKQWINNVKVIFVSHPCWDIALLKFPDGYDYITKELVVAEIPITSKNLEENVSVVVIGHSVFEPSINLQRIISQGIISNAAKVDKKPILIQASSSIHNGNSGGLLLSLPLKSRPQFLGVLTSNIQLSMSNSNFLLSKNGNNNTIIHLTFAIPCEALHDINIYLDTEDPHCLSHFKKEASLANSIWGLEFVPPIYNTTDQQERNHKALIATSNEKEETDKGNRGLLKALFPRALSA
ncbi:hypothetical protein LY90DRAFT_698017, partial [Neocallimastix californiae]